MPNFCVIILAAGEGKRMNSSLPKVMHEIYSKPMLSYVVDVAKRMKPARTIVVLGRSKPQVKQILSKEIRIAYQNKPLGTADAVKAAKKEISTGAKDIIVLYGDVPLITEATLHCLYDFHKAEGASCTVLTAFLDNPKGYGRILRNDSGKLVGIIEDKDADYQQKSIREVNSGIYCFKADRLFEALGHVQPLNKSGEFYLTDVLSWLFNKNEKIVGYATDDYTQILGVNSRVELMQASEIIKKRILLKHIDNGVSVMDLNTIFIDDTVKIGQGTKILPFTFIDKGVVIGKNCSVGPFCHLREGVVFEDNVSVGNFTELKHSTLGEGTFMRHLGYIGDTKVGKKVNIGAGTVVANFDGKKKSKTVIKDRAFIGCDSVLIAPVIVGANAVVGAGSVVTKNHNVRDGAVVAGIPAREIKKRK